MLLYTFLVHIICDFIIQSDDIVKKRTALKRSTRAWGTLLHTMFIPILLCPSLFIFDNFPSILWYIFLLFVSHYLIDFFKGSLLSDSEKNKKRPFKWLHTKNKAKDDLIYFVIDQLLHIVFILLLWSMFNYNVNSYFNNKFLWLNSFYNYNYLIESYYTSFINIIIFIIISGYCCLAGSFFIDKVFIFMNSTNNIPEEGTASAIPQEDTASAVPSEHDNITASEIAASLEDNNNNNNSKIIGIIERFIVLILSIELQYTAIAFVLTAKSIVRSDKFKDKKFAEQYLVGTLLSILISLFGGIIFNILKK